MHSRESTADRTYNDQRTFIVLLLLYFVVLFPILRADRYYNDDLKRALVGRQSWDATGRPLTTLLMRLLQCYNHLMVDISPLTQFAAIALLTWIGVWIGRRFSMKSSAIAALSAFPLGAQPFFLENLSYKFDALSMSLAMMLALVPILVTTSSRRGWWLGVAALFGSLNFYQAAVNAYLVFIVLEMILAQLNERKPYDVLAILFSRLLQAGITMLLYQLVVGVHINGWVKQNSEKISSLHELPLIAKNFIDYYAYVGSGFDAQWWLYFGPVLFVMALLPVLIFVRYALQQRESSSIRATVAIVVAGFLIPLAALVCAPGLLLILQKPYLQPRVLMGIGALLSAALITMQAALDKWGASEKWSLGLASMLAVGMCTFASAYGNALGEQKHYEERIAEALADDLSEVRSTRAVRAFLLQGSAGFATVTAHVVSQFPLIARLVPTYISANDMFHTHMFFRYYLPDEIVDLRLRSDEDAVIARSAVLAKARAIPPLRTRAFYELRLIDDVVLVTLLPVSPEHPTPAENDWSVGPTMR